MTFDRQGPQNTEATLKLAMEAAREEGIHKVVVASYSGETALKLAELEHEGIRLICVARARGKTGRPDGNLSGAMRQELEARGVTVKEEDRPCPERRRAGTFVQTGRVWPGGGGCPCAAHSRTGHEGVRGDLDDGCRCRSGGAA